MKYRRDGITYKTRIGLGCPRSCEIKSEKMCAKCFKTKETLRETIPSKIRNWLMERK